MPALDSERSYQGNSCPTVEVYNSVISSVNDMLLYQQFQECYFLCQKFALIAKNNAEDPNSVEARETLMVVGIQALAELNRWSEVIPFVLQIYGGFEECSPLIAKLCLQLYIKLRDKGNCSVIVNLWLQHPANLMKEGYVDLVDLYIDEILVPNGEWDEVKSFLEACPGLDSTAKESRWRKIQVLKRQQQLMNADKIEVLESSSSTNLPKSHHQQTNSVGWLPDIMQVCVSKINEAIQRHLSPTYFYFLRNVCIACLALYLLITRWQTGFLPDSIVQRFLTLLQRLWRGMFAPFYKSSR